MAGAPLHFTADEVVSAKSPRSLREVSAKSALAANDEVGVQLSVHATSGRLSVARVRLTRAAVVVRERGVVHAVKDGFGFLRCETRTGQVGLEITACLVPRRGGHSTSARWA